jgi:hypothetical protein
VGTVVVFRNSKPENVARVLGRERLGFANIVLADIISRFLFFLEH